MNNASLGNFIEITGGYAFKSSEFITEGIPVIRMSDLNEGEVKVTKTTVKVSDRKVDDKFIINKGDILIGLSGSIGKIGVVKNDGKMFLNQRLAKVSPKENIDNNFLLYLMKEISKRMQLD